MDTRRRGGMSIQVLITLGIVGIASAMVLALMNRNQGDREGGSSLRGQWHTTLMMGIDLQVDIGQLETDKKILELEIEAWLEMLRFFQRDGWGEERIMEVRKNLALRKVVLEAMKVKLVELYEEMNSVSVVRKTIAERLNEAPTWKPLEYHVLGMIRLNRKHRLRLMDNAIRRIAADNPDPNEPYMLGELVLLDVDANGN